MIISRYTDAWFNIILFIEGENLTFRIVEFTTFGQFEFLNDF